MRRLFTILSLAIIAIIVIVPVVKTEENTGVLKDSMLIYELPAMPEIPETFNDILASSKYERKLSKEFSVNSSPTLTISNEFGKINIKEGTGDKIIFDVLITGKGKNESEAKQLSDAVNINFTQTGNAVFSKTSLGKINCKDCGRSVDIKITAPKNTKYILQNKFGDITMNNASAPVEIKLEFGKLYAKELVKADIDVKHGGTRINKCENLEISSGFSKNKFGVIGSLSGKVEQGGFDIEEVSSANIESGFSKITIDRLKKSFVAKRIAHGSLKIDKIDNDFTEIKVDASFSKLQLFFSEKNNFKTILSSSFGNINIGKLTFLEKSLDKKDAVIGVIGKVKDPAAKVDISNSHGNISIDKE